MLLMPQSVRPNEVYPPPAAPARSGNSGRAADKRFSLGRTQTPRPTTMPRTIIPPTLATILVTALFLVTSLPAVAQQMYKCGNTYSQTPCDKTAERTKITMDARAAPPPGLIGKELCKTMVPRTVTLKDPYSARIDAVNDQVPEVIKVANEPIMARRFDVALNAKNSYGAYTGAKIYLCYLSEDQTRVLLIVPPLKP